MRPSELDLIALTVQRVQAVAAKLKITPQTVCKQIVKDNRLYPQLMERLEALQSGEQEAIDQTRSMTMSLYERLHRGLEEKEAA